MADTIREDVPTANTDPDDEGFGAFLSSLDDDPKKGSTEPAEEATDEPATETADEPTETTEEDAPDDDDPDNVEVEIKVGEETKKATLKDLKRLYGQEASLTQKSQKLAEQMRSAVEQDTRASTALKAMLDRAQARYQPYADLDMLVLAQRMDTESFEQLRKDAHAAHADVAFLSQELDGRVRADAQAAHAANVAGAQACIQVLSDPKTGIEGWGQPLYNDIMAFATENGLPAARSFVDPSALKLLHMAMLYARGQKASKTVAEKVAKVVATPARTLKPGVKKAVDGGYREAIAALRKSGDEDSTAAAFAASFDR